MMVDCGDAGRDQRPACDLPVPPLARVARLASCVGLVVVDVTRLVLTLGAVDARQPGLARREGVACAGRVLLPLPVSQFSAQSGHNLSTAILADGARAGAPSNYS